MVVGKQQDSLRPGRSELTVLAWAFGISLAAHLLTYGTYELGARLGLWQKVDWLALFHKPKHPLAADTKPTEAEQQAEEQIPVIFIETTPAQAVTEAPKVAKFYSDKNALATNPEADKDSNIPKIDGTQSNIPKTVTTPRNQNVALAPSLPAPELRAVPQKTTGDLAFSKSNEARDDNGKDAQSSERAKAEARAQQASKIAGEKVKQDGGSKRHLDFASYDTKATSFGAYDAAFIETVQKRWFDLLDGRGFVQGRQGRVTLEFNLNFDGRVTDVNIMDNNVGEVLGLMCEKAVMDPAPFPSWPSDMRRMLGNSRVVRFTFYYY
jgi:outer membrane biosynthesis protein TonB